MISISGFINSFRGIAGEQVSNNSLLMKMVKIAGKGFLVNFSRGKFVGHAFFKLVCLCLLLSACQTIPRGEHAVVFSKLPWIGGLKNKILVPGEKELKLPWIDFYLIDTSVQTISWGAAGKGSDKEVEDYVETRALDGNEVGLAMAVQYRVDPDRLVYLVQNVSSSNAGIRRLVTAVARADIRTQMNTLKTRDFFNQGAREKAVNRVKASLKARLDSEGIIIERVIYNDHRFERRLPEGNVDRSYQEQIDRTQATVQETQQERNRIAVVVAQKKQEFNDTQAKVNRQIEEVEGYKRQAALRGDSYLKAKQNEATKIAAVGNAEVEGLKKKIEALSGPGGEGLLRLELVKALVERNPKFVLLNSAKGSGQAGLDFSKVDMNDLIREAGLFVGAQEGAKQNQANLYPNKKTSTSRTTQVKAPAQK